MWIFNILSYRQLESVLKRHMRVTSIWVAGLNPQNTGWFVPQADSFYAVSDIGSADCKPGKDPGKCNLNPKNKWTPNKQGPKAEPPVWDPKTKKGRGSKHGNTPPGYSYVD